jgi:ribose 5-phosphate isomerase B
LWVECPLFCDFLYPPTRNTTDVSPGRFISPGPRFGVEVERGKNFMIAIGSDHGGVDLKDFLVGILHAMGVEVFDCGTHGKASVDYPDFGREVSLRVSSGEAERGVLVCTTGIGMSILANKFPAVRAALVQDLDTARSSREHNDANILVLSGTKTEQSLAKQILETWLATPFAGGRHQRRVDKICQIERDLGVQINGQVKK